MNVGAVEILLVGGPKGGTQWMWTGGNRLRFAPLLSGAMQIVHEGDSPKRGAGACIEYVQSRSDKNIFFHEELIMSRRAFLLKCPVGGHSRYARDKQDSMRTLAGFRCTSIILDGMPGDGFVGNKPSLKSLEIVAEGIFTGSNAEVTVKTSAQDQKVEFYQLVFEDGLTIAGRFQVKELGYAGDFNGERNYRIHLWGIPNQTMARSR